MVIINYDSENMTKTYNIKNVKVKQIALQLASNYIPAEGIEQTITGKIKVADQYEQKFNEIIKQALAQVQTDNEPMDA